MKLLWVMGFVMGYGFMVVVIGVGVEIGVVIGFVVVGDMIGVGVNGWIIGGGRLLVVFVIDGNGVLGFGVLLLNVDRGVGGIVVLGFVWN